MQWSDVFAWRSEAVPLAPVEYSGWLVLLSVAIAMFGGVAAMQLVAVARHAPRFGRGLATAAYLAAVLAMGASVWSMHFIGMLAVDLCQPVTYDPTITALSILPSLAASAVGLRLFLRPQASALQVVHAGVWLGAGIGVMHYSGMAAMELESLIRYDPLWFAASLVVAISLAIAGLGARELLRQRWGLAPAQVSLVSGAILGLAVSGMHYTAMQAALFVGQISADYVPWSSRQVELALAVAVVTCVVFGVAWGTVALTAYRSTANRLRERERLLSDILSNLPGAVVRIGVGQTRRRVLASPTLAELVGCDEALGDPGQECRLGERVLESDRPALQRAIELALADGDREQATVRLLRGDGAQRWVNIRVQAVTVEPGEEPLVDLYLSDVTEEYEIRARERQLLWSIDQVIGRAVLTPQGVFQEVNARLAQTLGYAPEEMPGLPHRLVWPEAAAGEVERFWNGLRAGEAQHGEFLRVAKDGSQRVLQGWYQPLRNTEGQIYAVLKLVVDVTERARMVEDLLKTQAELRAALASRSAFFANVSHEIRTPMNAVVGFAELLRDDLNDPHKRAQAQSILEAARALLRILNDLLDAAKLERGEFSLVEAPFRLDRLLNGLVSQFGALASAKGIDLRLDLSADCPRCWQGDGDRVRQILTNLLGNAIKFTERGHVTLRARHAGGALRLEVEDSGIGIPKDRQQAIFDPFVQADAGTARRYGGTGLGMGIVRQLAERMGGGVALESEPGLGTTVRVHLPLPVLPDGACAEAATTGPAAPTTRPLRLLAVDDVAQNRELLQALLRRAGHAVEVYDAAEALLARYEAEPQGWDGVLLDLHMPGVDGFSACRRLRAFEAAHGLPPVTVFALSASVHEDDRRAAEAAGMDGFLEKPIQLEALHRALGQLAGAPEPPASPVGGVADAARGEALWGADWLPRPRDWVGRSAGEWNAIDGWALADWHRMAGVAANFALPALAAVLRRGEAALKLGDSPPVAEALACWAELRQWLSIQGEAAAPAPASMAEAPDAAAVDAALARCRRACEEGEIDEAALAVLARADAPRAAALRAAFDAFDFDAAREGLAAWQAACRADEEMTR